MKDLINKIKALERPYYDAVWIDEVISTIENYYLKSDNIEIKDGICPRCGSYLQTFDMGCRCTNYKCTYYKIY